MLRMAVGHSDDVDPADAVAIAIGQCRAQLDGLEPRAGFLVAAFDAFDPSLVDAVRAAFPGCALMGSTSSAEMSSTSGFLEDSVTLALFASDDVDVTAGLGMGIDRDVDAACREAVAEARSTTDRDPKVCVVFADAGIVEPQRTLDALSRALPDGVVVVGGGSAWHSLGSGGPSWQFCDDRVTSEGVAVLLFSGPVASSVAVGTGWRSLGASGVVTRSASGRVDEIDGRPAVEFLARYLDVSAPASYGNPLAVREVGTTESYLRGIAGSDLESGALNVFGSVPIGSMVQLTTTTTEGILEGTRESIAAAAAGFPAGTRPEAALVFSCVARRMLLGSRAGAEVDLARSELGPTVPLAGLYCYGEIGPVSGSPSSRYFNTTFVTLLLGT